MSGERTEKASEQRKKQSRERGEGVRSRELTSSAAMLAGLLLLRGASTQFVRLWASTYFAALSAGMYRFDSEDALGRQITGMLMPALAPVLLILLAAFAGAVGAGALQSGGLQFRAGALAWKPGRINPGSNIQNLFSARSVMRFMKSMLPAAAVVAIASYSLRRRVLAMPVESYARMPVTLTAAYNLALDAAWLSLGWSLLDYANERRQWSHGLRMTKEEVKQETKESNGNPQVKGRIRQIQRAMRKRRVKADVSRAAVVITNPTHYAVALLFDFQHMAAPTVLSKGRDLHALEIREQARWSGVPIVENPPLARALFRSVDEGQSIPYELYAAVAAILAFLYRQSNERAAAQKGMQHRNYGYTASPRTILPLIEHEPCMEGREQL
jgi:flagellar biosynthetic protein FlhB